MDLKALSGLQAQREQLDARRSRLSGDAYQQGLEAFARASRSDFQDREALRQALDAWFEAIKQQRSNPEPYISLGYLFLLLGDSRTAVMYLKAAQNIAPRHPDPPVLIELLLREGRAEPAVSPAAAQGSIDDESFEALEAELRDWLRRIQTWQPPVPTPADQERLQLANCHQELAQALSEFQAQLIALEAEFDVSQLRARLRPLESKLQQYGQAIRLSEQFAELSATIQQLYGLTRKASQDIGDEPLPDLEQLLDDCDAIADRLEAIEAKGFDISPLSGPYEALCQAIEKLQDKLDEQA